MKAIAENDKLSVDFGVGDSIELSLKIFEDQADNFRIQKFLGICIGKKAWKTENASIIVMKLAKQGVIVQKTIPLHAPTLHAITVVRKGKIRRAKLYYLKKLKGNKSMKIKTAAY